MKDRFLGFGITIRVTEAKVVDRETDLETGEVFAVVHGEIEIEGRKYRTMVKTKGGDLSHASIRKLVVKLVDDLQSWMKGGMPEPPASTPDGVGG